jgi:ABC-type multidrug transport system ATPase subunit
MATKATTTEKAIPANPIDEMVEVFLPKVPGEANEKYVAINGKAWQIPRGKKNKVPMAVAEILQMSQDAEDAADKFSDEEQKKMAIIQGLP